MQARLWGLQEAQGRVPLHPLPLPPRDLYGPSLSLRFLFRFNANFISDSISTSKSNHRRPWPSVNLPSPPAASSKPSLDGILCTSLVALTNKHRYMQCLVAIAQTVFVEFHRIIEIGQIGLELHNTHREGKYWFKSGCPTPDPRWPAVQQLMV